MGTVSFDFTDAPAAQPTGGFEVLPPGFYRVKVSKFEDGQSGNGNRMITANYEVIEGPKTGSRLYDNFVLIKDDPSKRVGYQALHQCFLALGMNVQQKMSFDSALLLGRPMIVKVATRTMPAKGEYEERDVSVVREYHPNGATVSNGAQPTQAAPVAQQAAEAPAPAPTPTPEPVAVAVAAQPAVAEAVAPPPAEEAQIADVDDLFK